MKLLMANRFNQVWRSLIVGWLCLVVALSGFVNSHLSVDRLSKYSPALEPSESDSLKDEDPEGRSDWFFNQRAYPFDSIPSDARHLAIEQARSNQFESLLAPAAATVWQHIGPSPTYSAYYGNWGYTSGRINTVAVSPANPQIVLIGSSTGGLWRSTNGGSSFTPVSDDQVDLAVGSIAFAPSDPQIVYAGMGDTKLNYLGSGVLKSTNGGASWRKVSNQSLPSPATVARLEIDPASPNRIYLAQYSRLANSEIQSSGLFISTDGGVNWTKTFTGWARDVVINPANRQTIYLGVRAREPGEGAQPAGLYRSTDSGQTWSVILASPFEANSTRDFRVAVSSANPQKLYCYYGGTIAQTSEVRLSVSADLGQTWSDKSLLGLDTAAFGYNTYIYVDPTDAEKVYIGSRDLFRSVDGGGTWTNLTRNFSPFGDFLEYTPGFSNTHPDQHGFAFAPSNPNTIFLGNDGGFAKSTDGGVTFRSFNTSLSLTQFIGITLHPTNPAISYGGTQDNGTQRRTNGSSEWREFASGDGGRAVLSVSSPDIVFASYIRGVIFRYSNNGLSFDRQVASASSFFEPPAARIAFYPPFVGNGVNDTLYVGTWRLFVSADLGDTWAAPGGEADLTKGINLKGRDVLTAIGVSRSDTRVIYTGSGQGRAMATSDGGATWVDITTGLPDRFISSVTVDPTNSSTAFLTVSGYGTGHVFKTTDRGTSWTNLSNNLPDIPVNAFLIDPVSPNRLYVGTDIGVFRSTNNGSSWQLFNQGIPPVVVTAFTAQSGGLIQAATYGRGAYQIDVGADVPAVTLVNFDNKKKLTVTGRNFDQTPTVLINNVDRTSRIRVVTSTSIRLKGKPNQLGLTPGNNTIQIINGDGSGSQVYVFQYQG